MIANNPSGVLLDIFIMSHSRHAYLSESLSVLAHTCHTAARLVVSDNSPDKSSLDVLAKKYSAIEFKYRQACSAREHLMLVLADVSAPYCIILHDDDVPLPNLVNVYLTLLKSKPGYGAYACNGYLMFGSCPSKRLYFNSHRQSQTPSLTDYISSSLRLFTASSPPFPAYCYETKSLKKAVAIIADSKNKHDDIILICHLFKNTIVYWASEPVMYYRLHPYSDTACESISDRVGLLKKLVLFSPASLFDICGLSEYILYSSLRQILTLPQQALFSNLLLVFPCILLSLLSFVLLLLLEPKTALVSLKRIRSKLSRG